MAMAQARLPWAGMSGSTALRWLTAGVLGLGLVVVGSLASLLLDDNWQAWNDYGRWVLDTDRQTIRTERRGLVGCAPEYRARIESAADDGPWVLRFEYRSTGDECLLPGDGCISDSTYGCGAVMVLDRLVPVGLTVRAFCEPGQSPFSATVSGGARPTLGPTSGDGEPVVCSAEPET